MKTVYRFIFFSLLFLFTASLPVPLTAEAAKSLRVGIFPFEPINYMDKSGQAQGFNPDLLREIAREEHWDLEFVPGSWNEGLDRLQSGDIDLMVSVAYSQKRAESMDFTHESVMELWGQVYIRPEGIINNISDLAGRRVAVMRKDISGTNFRATAREFNVQCDILEFPTHDDVFTAVKEGVVDAGIAPQHFGLRHTKDYDLVPSTIQFSPFSIYFAAKKGQNFDVLSIIDRQLTLWKQDKESVYYQHSSNWLGMQPHSHSFSMIPRWLLWTLATIVVIVILLVIMNMILKSQVKKRTSELLASERYNRMLFDQSLIGLAVARMDGKLVDVNSAYVSIIGRSIDETLNLTYWDITPDKYVLQEQQILATLNTSGVYGPYEKEYIHKDGHLVPVRQQGLFIELKGEKHILSSVEDISERKKAEEQLASEKHLQQMLLDNFPGVVLLLRVSTREVVVSNRAGVNVGAVCGSTCFKTWGQSQEPCTWCLAENLWTSGKEQSTVIEVGEKVSEAHWVPVTDDLFLHYSFDITERKLAEKKLLENEHVIQQALIISNSFAFDWNTATDQVHRSVSCEKIFGIDYGKMVNATTKDYSQHVHPDDRLRLEHLLLNLRPSADTYTTDYRLVLSDGTVVSLEETAQAYFDDTGKTTRVIGVASDITKRKLAEEERTELERQLHQSQKIESVGRLAGGVAHDFNNMLSVIIGRTELAQMRSRKPESLHNDLDQILQAAMRSRDITQKLLAFARKQIIAPRVLDLNETVESMLTMLKQLLGENIDLIWQPKENLWPVELDPSQMDQILANLCINARDSIDDIGKMTIETDRVSLDQAYCHDHAGFVPGDFVMLAVSDDGCGMDKETLDKIFEPFFTTKPTGKGTGLGLSMVYGVVKQHNGFINVYSEPDEGTTFKIYLHRYKGQIAVESEAAGWELLKGQGETVLVVEDETSILTLIEEMLNDFGYKVLAANSPAEALDIANTHPGEIHLLITDVVMPGMNGRVLAGRLQSMHPQLKCLYMSGYTANVIAHHGVLDKGIHFIQKPFSRIDFSVHIRTALGL
ncbi:MAG: PAS domain S-box protein [Desulfuromonadales bacterium]